MFLVLFILVIVLGLLGLAGWGFRRADRARQVRILHVALLLCWTGAPFCILMGGLFWTIESDTILHGGSPGTSVVVQVALGFYWSGVILIPFSILLLKGLRTFYFTEDEYVDVTYPLKRCSVMCVGY